jgi:oxalate decarboxylase/phosphoglucose isomerase-like protein (cupin superfamily)
MIKFDSMLNLPLAFDSQSHSLIFDENIIRVKNVKRYKVRNLRKYLLNRELKYPDDIYLTYRKVRNLAEKRKFHVDITIIPENLIGIEYTKTVPKFVNQSKYGMYRMITILNGSATLIIQSEGEYPQDIYIVKLDKKHHIYIPQGYYYQFINTRSIPVVLAEFYMKDIDQAFHLKQRKGMAFYIICKNAKQEIVQNPNYKHIPNITKLKSAEFNKKYAPSLNKSIESLYSELSKSDLFLDNLA